MLRTYGSLALAAVLFAVPSALRAQNPEAKKVETDLKALIKQLDDASWRLDEATRKLEIARQRIIELEDQVKSQQVTLGLANEIRAKMAELDKALAKMQSGVRVDTFKKDYSAAMPGRILMANHYVEDLTFYINNKRYVVQAQSTVLVDDVPPGPFSYKVVSPRFGERLFNPDALLAPGQTYTLSAK